MDSIRKYIERLHRYLTLTQIAKLSGLSVSEISRLRKGERIPKFTTLEKLRVVNPELFDKIVRIKHQEGDDDDDEVELHKIKHLSPMRTKV